MENFDLVNLLSNLIPYIVVLLLAISCHEAGHALVAAMIPGADPLHKVTIIPRGMALGVTLQLPADDKHNYSKEFLEARIAICMGGRVAEEIVMGSITTGAGNDIEQATDMARRMVCEWGMSDLGPLAFGGPQEQIFLGREISQHRDFSEDTAIRIDKEVRRLVQHGYERARTILEEGRQHLVSIAEALLDREVLDLNEVNLLIAGKPLPERQLPPSGDGPQPQVLKPEPPRRVPGFAEGGPAPA